MAEPYRILIVADDPDQNELFDIVLRRAGYHTVAVGDGEAALTHLATTAFDAVLTDYLLPGITGDRLIQALKRQRSHPAMVLMSNHVDVRQIAIGCQADAWYRKDDIFELPLIISRVLLRTRGVPHHMATAS